VRKQHQDGFCVGIQLADGLFFLKGPIRPSSFGEPELVSFKLERTGTPMRKQLPKLFQVRIMSF
jgi:hypothetical protein